MRNQPQLTVVIIGSDLGVTNLFSKIVGDVEGVIVLDAVRSIVSALEAIARLQPQVVILDANMPRFGSMHNGIDVLKWIKQNYPAIQVVMLVSHSDPSQRAVSEQLGAYECLDKLAGMQQLCDVLRALRMVYVTKSLDGIGSLR